MATSSLWQKLIWAVLFLLVVEGGLRKWVLPEFQASIYLIKDVMLILAYAAFLTARLPPSPHTIKMRGLKSLMIASLIYFTLQVFNPNSPSWLLSLVGLKNYLLYAPLVFVVPYLFTSALDMERKLKTYALMMFPFVALGLVQFGFGPDHWLNGYLSHDDENLRTGAMFGDLEKIRTTGTFSYISGYVIFLTVIMYLTLGLAAARSLSVSQFWKPLLLVVTVGAIFTTGSRAPFYMLVASLPLLLSLWAIKGLLPPAKLMQLGILAVVVIVVVQFVASDAIEAFQYRSEHSDDPIMRVLSPLTELYDAAREFSIVGAGLGSTSAAAITIMGTTTWWWLQGIFFEQETARVLQESGFLGFLLVYAARIWLLAAAIKMTFRFRSRFCTAMGGAIAAFLAISIFSTVINNATAGIYYWFSAGLLFALYRIEHLESGARAQSGQSQKGLRPARVTARPVVGAQ